MHGVLLGWMFGNNSDLKPENILIDYVGHISLCDFGLCKLNMTETETTNSEFPSLRPLPSFPPSSALFLSKLSSSAFTNSFLWNP